MNDDLSVKATSSKKWIVVMLSCVALIYYALYGNEETIVTRCPLIMIPALVICMVKAFIHAIYSCSMSNQAILAYCFGREYHHILWRQVKEVSIVKDSRSILGRNGISRIIVVPEGCPTSELQKKGGVAYWYKYHKQVIWMDDTKENREFIEKKWGAISDYRYSKN